MTIRKARTISESDVGSGTILAPPSAPAIKGDGSIDIVCGACGTVLIEGIQPSLALRSVVIRCPECRQVNGIE